MFIELCSFERSIYNFRSKYDNSKPNIIFFVQTIYTVKSSEYVYHHQKQNKFQKYFQKWVYCK